MPPRSPDLASTDYYFWGVVKDKACTTKPKMPDLKSAIEDAFAKTGKDQQLCKAVCSINPECIQQCITSEGSQLE
jgi:hypothetical protein